MSIYDISTNQLSKDEQAQLRCSNNNLDSINENYCKNICHDNCLGCFKSNSSMSCVKCRYESFYDNGRLICLESCPKGFEKNNLLHFCEGEEI